MTYVSCLSVNVDSYSDLTTDNLKRDVNSVENDRLVTMVTLITAVN